MGQRYPRQQVQEIGRTFAKAVLWDCRREDVEQKQGVRMKREGRACEHGLIGVVRSERDVRVLAKAAPIWCIGLLISEANRMQKEREEEKREAIGNRPFCEKSIERLEGGGGELDKEKESFREVGAYESRNSKLGNAC
eukprot:3252516-Pleurochrysis_carterae.AAC.7